MRFTYTGPEHEAHIFGLVFPLGVAVNVDDAHAISKLSVHPQFKADAPAVAAVSSDQDELPPQKRRGRPPKVKHDNEG